MVASNGAFKLLDEQGRWWIDACCYDPPDNVQTGAIIFLADGEDATNWTDVTASVVPSGRNGSGFEFDASGDHAYKDLGANDFPAIVVGFAFYTPTLTGFDAGARIVGLWGNYAAYEQIGLVIQDGGDLVAKTGSTVHGTATGAISVGWNYVEVAGVIGEGTAGSVRVRVNNTLVMSNSGDTQLALSHVIDSIHFDYTGVTTKIDDIYVYSGIAFMGDQGDTADGYVIPTDPAIVRPLKVQTESGVWEVAACMALLAGVPQDFGYVTKIQYGFGLTFVHPSTLQVGDLMVLNWISYWPMSMPAAPNWQELHHSGYYDGTYATGRTIWKIAEPGDIAGTTQTTTIGNNYQACGVMQIFRGVNKNNPFHDSSAAGSTGIPTTIPTVSNGSGTRLGLYMGATRGTNAPLTVNAGTIKAAQNDDRMGVVAAQEPLTSGESRTVTIGGTYVPMGAPGTQFHGASMIINGG